MILFPSGLEKSFPRGKDCSLYVGIVMISFSVCLFLFYFVSPKFSSLVSSRYHQLPEAKRIDWDTRYSLRSKHFRGVSVGFQSKKSPKNGVFKVLAAQKMGREQKMRGGRKEGNTCRQTPGF